MSEAEAYPGLPKELAFSSEEYSARVEGVRAEMRARDLDVLLVQHPTNVAYLSGYQSKVTYYSETVVVPLEGRLSLIVLEWEVAVARLHTWIDQVLHFDTLEDFPAELAKLFASQKLTGVRVGVETRSLAVTAKRLEAMREAIPNCELVDASGLVETLKVIKSPAEIGYVRSAARITDMGVSAAIEAVAPGVTDNDVAAAAYTAMIGGGSEFMSIDPCILSGRRTGIIHASHKRVPIRHGDPVIMEMGAVFQRYTAPLQRSASLGEPSAEMRRFSDASFAAIENVLEVLRPGASSDEVNRAAAAGLELAGPDAWSHRGAAYAVGIAFPPNWVEGSFYIGGNNPMGAGGGTEIREGMVLHLPMSLRKRGVFGVMQSETVVITSDGCEALSKVERRLFVK